MACSLKTRSVSARNSSEIGAGPSLRSPLFKLNACGFVRFILLPLGWGIKEERSPVDSSHACGETEVGLDEVTEFQVNTG